MTLLYTYVCVFLLSAFVWGPLGFWMRSAIARAAKPEVVKRVRADIDKCNGIYGDVPNIPPHQGAV